MITPVFREEFFLDAIINGTTPPDPIFRVEFFLAKIAGADVETPTPIFRIEKYLAKIGGEDVEIPDPVFREEYWLAKKCGENVTTPTPVFRLEYFLEEWVNGSAPAYQSITGKIVDFITRRIAPLKIEAALEPKQDLHGQDAPWPPGGGVNIFLPSNSDYSGTETNGITISYSKNTEQFAISGTNTKTDASWLYYNQDTSTFEIGELVAGETLYFSHNLPTGAYSQITYRDGNNTAKNLFYLSGNGTFRYASATIPNDIDHLDRFQIGFVKTAGNVTTANVCFEVSKSIPTAWTPYSNICPISGHTGADVYVTGTNVWDEEWESGDVNVTNGEKRNSSTRIRSKNYTPVVPNTEYYFVTPSRGSTVVCFYDESKTYVSTVENIGWQGIPSTNKFTTPSWCKYILFYYSATTYDNDVSINYPSTDTDYHAFSGSSVTISFGSTVYGGNLVVNEDGTGQVDCDHFLYVYDGTENFSKSRTALNGFYNQLNASTRPHNWPSMVNYSTISNITDEISSMFAMTRDGNAYKQNYGLCFLDTGMNFDVPPETFGTTVDSFKAKLAELYAAGTPVSVWVKIQTPFTVSVTASQINALQGNNTVWVDDSDEIKVTYRSN